MIEAGIPYNLLILGDRIVEGELTIGGGHASGELGWVHVGLGDAGSAEVRIRWPDGEVGPWQEVAANAFVTIPRHGEPTEWSSSGAASTR